MKTRTVMAKKATNNFFLAWLSSAHILYATYFSQFKNTLLTVIVDIAS